MDTNERAYWTLVEWMIVGEGPVDRTLLVPARIWLQEHPDLDPYMLSRINATLKKLGYTEPSTLTARQAKRRAKLGTAA